MTIPSFFEIVAGYDFEDKLEERIVLSDGYHAPHG